MKAYLDANFFIIALLDREKSGEIAYGIHDALCTGKFIGYTSSLTFDEIMWVLKRNKKPHLIAEAVNDLYTTPNLKILPVSAEVPLLSLEYIKDYGLNPRDAFHLAVMAENEIQSIVSDDSDFAKIKGIKHFSLPNFLKHLTDKKEK